MAVDRNFVSTQVISFNCILKNKAGFVISTTFNRDVITSVGFENGMLKGLATGLQNISKGEKRRIAVPAEDAYGLYEPKKQILFPKKKLPENLKVGQSVNITGKSGTVRTYKVTQIHDDMVGLDGNHPLAGQDLVFEIEALEVRLATHAEISDSINSISIQHLH